MSDDDRFRCFVIYQQEDRAPIFISTWTFEELGAMLGALQNPLFLNRLLYSSSREIFYMYIFF